MVTVVVVVGVVVVTGVVVSELVGVVVVGVVVGVVGLHDAQHSSLKSNGFADAGSSHTQCNGWDRHLWNRFTSF